LSVETAALVKTEKIRFPTGLGKPYREEYQEEIGFSTVPTDTTTIFFSYFPKFF
jgi:hypothetical protein